MAFYTITKGELSCLRSALEEDDAETRKDALDIVNAILEKNVTVEITAEQMYHDPMEDELTAEELLMLHSGPEVSFDD